MKKLITFSIVLKKPEVERKCRWWARKPEKYKFTLDLDDPIGSYFSKELDCERESDILNIKAKIFIKKFPIMTVNFG